jgi:hypothetical protein
MTTPVVCRDRRTPLGERELLVVRVMTILVMYISDDLTFMLVMQQSNVSLDASGGGGTL